MVESTTRCYKPKPPVWINHLYVGSIVTWLEVQEAASILWLCSCPAGHPSQDFQAEWNLGPEGPGSSQLRNMVWLCSLEVGLSVA